MRSLLTFLGGAVKVLRLALPKIGVGWMFALLSVNFNRVTIKELGVAAIIVTVMTGMHNFLSPFQVIFGRFADRRPILGLRRTPLLLASTLAASLVFLALPAVAQALGRAEWWAIPAGLLLFVVFGVGVAAHGDSHHALIAETTGNRQRGLVMSVVWTMLIVSTIASAITIRVVMPEYTPEAMQRLYNLTPWVVIGSALLGVLGLERRLKGAELSATLAQARQLAPAGSPLRAAASLLREQPAVRTFFLFMFLSILAIFIQDSILEVFGGEVFGMSPGETASFTSTWGGAVLIAMLLVGLLSALFAIRKKTLAMVGGAGTALGLGMLTVVALGGQRSLITPALVVMGLSTGVFNVGALALMLDMTLEGATGLYMGMWGVAQAFGMGCAAIVSGGLHSLLIGSGLLDARAGYTAIFGLETVLMVVSIAVLRGVSVEAFRGLTREELVRTIEASATA
jgi:BCD family chlorophyll transporter-like MFS transporter